MKLLIDKQDIKKITQLKGYALLSHQRRKKAIVKLVIETIPPGSDVLDIGCASGDFSIELSCRGFHLHGLDSETKRLNNARKLCRKYRQDILFENKPLKDIDKNRTYDLILMGEIIEHFSDPVKVLREVKPLLKSNGKVMISTPNMPSLRNRLKFGLSGVFPDNNPEHLSYFDYCRFSKVATDAGYRISDFKTRFTNLILKSATVSVIEDLIFFWFTLIFKKSGDTIVAVIYPDPEKKH
jgi:SAM-dependent methyltransferase